MQLLIGLRLTWWSQDTDRRHCLLMCFVIIVEWLALWLCVWRNWSPVGSTHCTSVHPGPGLSVPWEDRPRWHHWYGSLWGCVRGLHIVTVWQQCLLSKPMSLISLYMQNKFRFTNILSKTILCYFFWS